MTRIELWKVPKGPRGSSFEERECEFIVAWENGGWSDPAFEEYQSPDFPKNPSDEEVADFLLHRHQRPPLMAFDADHRPDYLEKHAAEQIEDDK